MGEWGDLTFDRKSEAWGSVSAGFEGEGVGESGGEAYLELLGSELWVAGMVDLGRFRRVSDYLNIVDGYMVLRDVVVLSRDGDPSRLSMPELRVLPADIAVVGQTADEQPQAATEGSVFIEKRAQRVVLLTPSHIVDGDVLIQVDSSIMAYLDASDPKFIPMSDVRVRRVADRKLAARYPFAFVQRAQIRGIATEGIRLGGAEDTVRRAASLKAQGQGARDADGLDGDIGPAAGAGRPGAGGAEEAEER
jgi:hypothetical protein